MVKKTARSVAIAWNNRELELQRRVNEILVLYPWLQTTEPGLHEMLEQLLA